MQVRLSSANALAVVIACLVVSTGWTAEPNVRKSIEATGLASGLAVTLGCDAATDRAILQAAPNWLLLSLCKDVAAADARRAELRHESGRVVVQPLLSAEIRLQKSGCTPGGRHRRARRQDPERWGDRASTPALWDGLDPERRHVAQCQSSLA